MAFFGFYGSMYSTPTEAFAARDRLAKTMSPSEMEDFMVEPTDVWDAIEHFAEAREVPDWDQIDAIARDNEEVRGLWLKLSSLAALAEVDEGYNDELYNAFTDLADYMNTREEDREEIRLASDISSLEWALNNADKANAVEAIADGLAHTWGRNPESTAEWMPEDVVSWSTGHGNFQVLTFDADTGRADIVDLNDEPEDEPEDEEDTPGSTEWGEQIIGPPTVERTYGRQRNAVRALRAAGVEDVQQTAAFKRLFPKAFEVLKHKLPGGNLKRDDIQRLIDSYGMDWLITTADWEWDLQRACADSNRVVQFNVDLTALTSDQETLRVLEAVRQTSIRSNHPVLGDPLDPSWQGLMTIGWIRLCWIRSGAGAIKALLIEEVQSDVPIVRKGIAQQEMRAQMLARGVSPEQVSAALDLLQPFADRFYYDAMSLAFDWAAKYNVPVEMLSWEAKREITEYPTNTGEVVYAPKSVYDKLPKQMGMVKVEKCISCDAIEDIVIADHPIWWIDPASRPNPSR